MRNIDLYDDDCDHDAVIVIMIGLYNVLKKLDHHTHGGNFVKSKPIFKLRSLLDLAINLQ